MSTSLCGWVLGGGGGGGDMCVERETESEYVNKQYYTAHGRLQCIHVHCTLYVVNLYMYMQPQPTATLLVNLHTYMYMYMCIIGERERANLVVQLARFFYIYGRRRRLSDIP